MGIVKAGNVAAYEGSVRERAELPQHAEVIADSPALGDPAVDEPVGKRHIPDSSTGRQRISKEGSSGPVQLSGAELHAPTTRVNARKPTVDCDAEPARSAAGSLCRIRASFVYPPIPICSRSTKRRSR